MDLRSHIKSKAQIDQGVKLIAKGDLFYQPFILSDDLEVGEGQNFCDAYKNVQSVFDNNVYADGYDFGDRRLASDKKHFSNCNQMYREQYEYIADQIVRRAGTNLSKWDFAEVGCNTGLNLFELAKAGAKNCRGYDWNDMSHAFKWLNGVLSTNVQFRRGTWNNALHKFEPFDVPEADVMLNTVFTNHQCDPLQFLAFICDRARQGVLLWVLVSDSKECVVRYPSAVPHDILTSDRGFPLNFNNDVQVSEPLLKLSLKHLGFGEVTRLDPPTQDEFWKGFNSAFRMYYAKRTSPVKSFYWKMPNSMKLSEPPSRLGRLKKRIIAKIR